jgi:hypothetical protein
MRILLLTTGALLLAGFTAACILLPALVGFAMAVGCATAWVALLDGHALRRRAARNTDAPMPRLRLVVPQR